ncbi:MAG: hypothetical protein Ta2B_24900 [Termitinemataceae bacterium]|nr:MAG: hypothetical protein Ta2B_24900 [Termitinemataceae bacterium]
MNLLKYFAAFHFAAAFVFSVLVVSCADSKIYTEFAFVLPQLSIANACSADTSISTGASVQAWSDFLGDPSWHIEWTDDAGNMQQTDTTDSILAGVHILAEFPTAIIAYPYWPKKNIVRGSVKPAGAIFPFDSSADKIILSWQGGIDASLYCDLKKENNLQRLPHTFDWNRFRSLFSEDVLPLEIVEDPWLADWKLIAAKTAASGFDKRRITAADRELRKIEIPLAGIWAGSSPFAKTQNFAKDQLVNMPVCKDTESYFSPACVLYVNNKTSISVYF